MISAALIFIGVIVGVICTLCWLDAVKSDKEESRSDSLRGDKR